MAFGSMNSGDDAPMSDINVTPLVDVMLVLLIVFMITMPVLTHSIPLELPTASEKAAKEDKQQPKDPLRLSIDANGAYVVGGDSDAKVDLATVTAKLKEAKAKNEDVIVAIAADKAVEYDYVNQALQAAREAEAARLAAERKAEAERARSEKAIADSKKEVEETRKLSTVDRMVSGGFEANKGRLPMPITGSYRIVSHFGQYNVEGLKNVKLDNKGINILGGNGCQARSIYDGEVSAVFGYGGSMVVMVRHGAYISVYANLRSASVTRGQRVSTRQTLGTVGADNILQFQLRKETAKLNPEAWLGR